MYQELTTSLGICFPLCISNLSFQWVPQLWIRSTSGREYVYFQGYFLHAGFRQKELLCFSFREILNTESSVAWKTISVYSTEGRQSKYFTGYIQWPSKPWLRKTDLPSVAAHPASPQAVTSPTSTPHVMIILSTHYIRHGPIITSFFLN